MAVVVMLREGKEPGLARRIAETVAHRTRDVRQAIQLARLINSQEELDRFEGDAGGGRLL